MILIYAIVIIFFVIQIVSYIGLIKGSKNQAKKASTPQISLLLAARNEEKLIIRCLENIEKLNYPKNKIEILIGNDDSTDKTVDLINNFIGQKPNYTLIHINENMGKARGKANVIAHLAKKAKGSFYFITDVDVALPSEWINRLLSLFTPEVGIVSGTTSCHYGPSLFSKMQSIDWLHFMGYIKAFANYSISCTAVGNNMAVRAEAYKATGGFEDINFSITEDYKLFEAVTKLGWQWATDLDNNSYGKAWYIESISEMLHQRKRWLIGAKDLPMNWKLLLGLYGLFYPALLVLGFFNTPLAIIIWTIKFCIQSVFIHELRRRMAEKPLYLMYFIYELYLMWSVITTALFYILPIKSVWKGRVYSSNNLSEE